ncbi:MAG: TRAP transporter substrate-binding protein [Clostridiaceae bacterium]|jgi:tripartite ATP-independent transporter DctP family solute receptor|nr:TRAP transporter substrate-binding protein [Clostridiaceae bacterium]
MMRISKLIFRLWIGSVFFLMMTGCDHIHTNMKETYAYTFRLGESHPSSHPTAQADVEFARRVEEETGGRIKIIVYFDQELGTEPEVIEQVRFGAIDFTRVSIANLVETVPDLYVLQLPYLYEDRDHMWRVLESDIGDGLLEGVGDYGFIGLTWFDAGSRSFYTRDKPIEKLEDLQGLSIRMMENSLMREMSKAMGFTGVLLPYGEIYPLIQQGALHGAENNFSSYLTQSHYQVAPFFSMDEHLRIPEILIGSKIALSNISQEDWAIIRKVARETTVYQKQLWSEMEEKAKERLIEEGVQIIELKDRSAFVQAVQPVYDKYEEQYGELIRRIKAE